jgi:hypothetical protein
MDLNIIDKNSPLNYNEWYSYHTNISSEDSEKEYLLYLKNWYFKNSNSKENFSKQLRNDYVQLLKDLSFLFSSNELNLFIKQLDYNNDEEIIFAIPFFAKKLKQIALIYSKKRESIKQAKLKYNLIGSKYGIEKILYDYILKGFTKSDSNLIRVPSYEIYNNFPELSAIKNDFIIEIEELHDKNTYLDSDPSVNILNYVDIEKFESKFKPSDFLNLSDDDIVKLISTRFSPKASTSIISKVFNEFIDDIPNINNVSEYNIKALNFINTVESSKKYLGQPVYGLTAIKLKDVDVYDDFLNLNFNTGNNWFYWPSGDRVLNDGIFNNAFIELNINNSNLIASGATGGDSYTNSDLIFTDKSGIVEGAWLRGIYNTKPEKNNIRCYIKGSENREFIFPYAGVDFSPKTSKFSGYKLSDENNFLLDSFESIVKEEILTNYFTGSLPTSSCNPIYINNTSLISNGSYADTFSDAADNIIKKSKTNSKLSVYDEENNNPFEQAYLYKFDKTDIPIKNGLNNIYWPLQNYTEDPEIKLTLSKNHSLPISLSEIKVSNTMSGAVAGLDFQTGDVIYKFNTKDSDPTEAAWLGSASITRLDTEINSIKIYDIPAINCAQYIDGPIQPSLAIKVNPIQKQSFIWMDEDTYADDVFKYTPHLPTCPYNKQAPYDYYSDQDYHNENPINDLKHWKKCNCKSVQYSPIGHSGESVTDFNGMADYLFADPDGLGEDFALNSWKDTRNLTVKNSPQFSFYKLNKDSVSDINVGWGNGYWKTGNGKKMVLKCGRRYTYCRTSLRSNRNDSPYFIGKYNFNKINGLLDSTDGYDLVIVIDRSKSQSLNLETSKKCVIDIIDKILSNNNDNIQIGLISFGLESDSLSFLSSSKEQLKLKVNSIFVPAELYSYETKILNSLTLAEKILTTRIITDEETSGITDLCKNLNFKVLDNAIGNTYENYPQDNKPKKILFFSDGEESELIKILSNNTYSTFDDTYSELEKKIIDIQIELQNSFNVFSDKNLKFKNDIEDRKQYLTDVKNNLTTYKETYDNSVNLFKDFNSQLTSSKSEYDKKYESFANTLKNELEDELLKYTNEYNSLNNLPKKQRNKNLTAIQNIQDKINDLNNQLTIINSSGNKDINNLLLTQKKLYNARLDSAGLDLTNINNLPPKKAKPYAAEKETLTILVDSLKIKLTDLNTSIATNTKDELILSNLRANLDSLLTTNSKLITEIQQLESGLTGYEFDTQQVETSYKSFISVEQSELDILNYEKELLNDELTFLKQQEILLNLNSSLSIIDKINNVIINFIETSLKKKNINIFAVDIGLKSYNTDLIERMSSSYSNYFNLQKYLDYGDGDLKSFVDYVSMRINGSIPVVPIWYKAKRNVFGTWDSSYDEYGNLEISDIILNPGDYLGYVHRSNVAYYAIDNQNTDFNISSLSFTINVKLNGWDYDTNNFSIKNIGDEYGAKPFWAKVNLVPDESQNFNKETLSFGGKIKFVDEYLPVQQPTVSEIYLQSGDVVEYVRKKQSDFIWNQPITIFNTESNFVWNKLIFRKDISNLKDIMNKQKLDGIVIESNEASDLMLEGYSSYKPVKYNYYARNSFNYQQGLYKKNRCLDSFYVYTTGIIIEPANPHENILNIHYPTVATSTNPYNIVSYGDVGGYLLPENLGLSYYRGRGYNISLNNEILDYTEILNLERIYFDLEKFGPRNRGLTKKDQLTITKIDSIDNSWIMEPYSSAEKSGTMIDTLENQKMIPYQTNYEIENKNRYGLSRQDDNFKFWNPENPPVWTEENNFPLTFRKELTKDVFIDRKNKLLVEKGTLKNWRQDIFGNEYGLYKQILPNDISKLELWFSSNNGVITDDINNIPASDGQIVKKWLNRSSNIDMDLVLYSGVPKYKHLGINNLPSITFNLSSTLDVLKNNYEINLNELTFIIIGKVGSVTSSAYLSSIISFGDSVGTNYLSSASLTLSLSSDIFNFSFGNISTNEQINLNSSLFNFNVTDKHVFEFEFSNSSCFSYIDSILVNDSSTMTNTLTSNIYSNKGMWVGSHINGLFTSPCEISEIILYSKTLNNIEKRNVYNYINTKYDFDLNLP